MAQDLLAVIASVIDSADACITEESSCATVDAWDSLAELMLASTLEYHYNVSLTLGELEQLKSVSQIRSILRAHGVVDV